MAQQEHNIVELLESTSKICNVIKTLPTAAKEYKDVSEELNFKVKHHTIMIDWTN